MPAKGAGPLQSSPHFTDVLVVGGGVIGLPAAWRLAREGASVRVIDASGTRGATWASAGMLAPVSESFFGEEDLLRLNLVAPAAGQHQGAVRTHRVHVREAVPQGGHGSAA